MALLDVQPEAIAGRPIHRAALGWASMVSPWRLLKPTDESAMYPLLPAASA